MVLRADESVGVPFALCTCVPLSALLGVSFAIYFYPVVSIVLPRYGGCLAWNRGALSGAILGLLVCPFLAPLPRSSWLSWLLPRPIEPGEPRWEAVAVLATAAAIMLLMAWCASPVTPHLSETIPLARTWYVGTTAIGGIM